MKKPKDFFTSPKPSSIIEEAKTMIEKEGVLVCYYCENGWVYKQEEGSWTICRYCKGKCQEKTSIPPESPNIL